ncbi:hypothetical protein KI387_037791, partial [Taxus chinensis]
GNQAGMQRGIGSVSRGMRTTPDPLPRWHFRSSRRGHVIRFFSEEKSGDESSGK